jgi:hypothetical protein
VVTVKKKPGPEDYWQKSLRARISAYVLEFDDETTDTRRDGPTTVEITDQESGIVELKIGENLYVRAEKELLLRAIENFEADHK